MNMGMNDTFSIVAPVMPRRHLDPFLVRLAAVGLLLAVLAGAFATFVVTEQRNADARRAGLEARIRTLDEARAQQLAAQAEAAQRHAITGGALPAGVTTLLDEQARANAEAALARARSILSSHASLATAGAAALARMQPSLVFVDGPSTAPSIISVDATGSAWAAATMAPSGTCYWVLLDAAGTTSYGTGDTCTGRAALAAADPSW